MYVVEIIICWLGSCIYVVTSNRFSASVGVRVCFCGECGRRIVGSDQQMVVAL
jgi:hypothetical protein